MRVAVDADCLAADGGEAARGLMEYVCALARALRPVVERVMLITRSENHARFEPLRDELTDVVLVRRPLFEGREVADWAGLLEAHPRVGGDLLAAHQQEKLRVMGQLGAQVLHFPTDSYELMEIDVPIVLTAWEAKPRCLSAELADALVVHDRGLSGLPQGKTFVVPMPSTDFARAADDELMRAPAEEAATSSAAATALAEAYEHALASFELRKAA
jgi:hypothetical protein